jgi:hypothetical protein
MKKLLVTFLFLLTGCATQSAFNQENIDKLYVGMSATSVKQIFGDPSDVRLGTCGGNTSSGTWICETWGYRITDVWSGRIIRSSFTFSVDNQTLGNNGKKLNNWDVKR